MLLVLTRSALGADPGDRHDKVCCQGTTEFM